MINVLHLSNSWGIGGAENVLINLTSGLKKDTFYSIVGLIQDGPLNEELRDRGIETYVIKNSLKDLGFLLKLLKIIKNRKINLIHSHEFLMNVYGTLAGKIMSIPVVTNVHGKNYYKDKLRRIFVYRYVSKNSQMVAVCEDLKSFLIERIGIKDDKIKTIYNGIDINIFKTQIRDSEKRGIRSKLGICDEDFIIGNVGNLRPEKGHIYLLKAAPLILNQIPNAKFLLIGRGGCKEKLVEEAKKAGILNTLKFLGFRKDVFKLLTIMDLFVLPSLSECFPLSILEAMASGVPVVATDVGGNREVIVDGMNGYIIPPRSPESIANKVLMLYQNAKLRRDASESGKETIEEKFKLEDQIAQCEKLYINSIQKSRSKSF